MSSRMLTLVVVVRNCAPWIEGLVSQLSRAMTLACTPLDLDHEILFVDNGSTDQTFDTLSSLMGSVADLRAISLVSSGEPEPACLAGMEHALGDWVVLFDPTTDSVLALGAMAASLASGCDLVLAKRAGRSAQGWIYAPLSAAFVLAFRRVVGVDLRAQAGRYRGMSRRVVAWVTSHDNAAQAHRALPSLGGFATTTIDGSGPAPIGGARGSSLAEGFAQALALSTSASSAPLRAATLTCAAAAGLSLAYSVYVAVVYLLGTNVAAGWTTMSLQISGMFFLLAIAVALLSEHVLHMASSSLRRPPYHMARECHSARISREHRLNVV